MTTNRYLYSAVRVVPVVATGEFMNIAVIAGSDATREWSMRAVSDERRLRGFCGPDALAAAHEALTNIGYQLDAISDETSLLQDDLAGALDSDVSESWLQRLYESSRHTVQFSAPAPVLASSVEAALDMVFPRLTVTPTPRTAPPLTKLQLMARLGRSYVAAGLSGADYVRLPCLVAGENNHFSSPIDFAVANGSAVQLVQTWSFEVAGQDVLSREIKAWGWTIHELKSHGGLLRAPERDVPVPPDVAVEAVVAPPREEGPVDAYQEALELFHELAVHVEHHGQEAEVAKRGAQLLGDARRRKTLF